MYFCTLGGLFLGNHGNTIRKYHVFVLSVSSANTFENLGSKTLKMKKNVFVVVDRLKAFAKHSLYILTSSNVYVLQHYSEYQTQIVVNTNCPLLYDYGFCLKLGAGF